ncbi:hypothetical protein TWF970_000802 [Orbilia oligospora]|uniref:Uncharacterized protein n=1 Tax=Orbilia oligospora TaxID=2813651 RepID=A0A7C8RHL5_ORBOL|nr:hypothetical protein TWF970_000802 [Orbilia oligospora]
MSSKLLPLSHSAQHQLEQRKAEIVKVHGQRDCPAEVQNAEKTLPTQNLELRCQVIDSAIAQTINEAENLHNLLTGVSNRLDAVFERYVTTEETVEDVTGRLGVVEYEYKKLDVLKDGLDKLEKLKNKLEKLIAIENGPEKVDLVVSQRLGVMEGKLEKLEVAMKSDRVERLEVINHNAWAFNNQASDKHDRLRPLKVAKLDRDQNLSFEVSPHFPLFVSRVGHLSVLELWQLLLFYDIVVHGVWVPPRARGTTLILPLVDVQKNLDICLRAFVRHIGLKWEVVEKLELFH